MPRKGRKVRSMRGTEVDFDLMDIKSQMASQPKSVEVKAREDFIEQRLRRRAKRRAERVAQQVTVTEVEPTIKTPSPDVVEEYKPTGALPPIEHEDDIGKTASEIAEQTTTRRIKKKTEDDE